MMTAKIAVKLPNTVSQTVSKTVSKTTMRSRPFAYVVPSVSRTACVTSVCLAVMVCCMAAEHKVAECALAASGVLGSVMATYALILLHTNPLLCFARPKRAVMLQAVVEGAIAGMMLPSTFAPGSAFLLVVIFTFAARSLAPQSLTLQARPVVNVPALAAATAWIVGADEGSTVLQIASAWDENVTDALNIGIFNLFSVNVPQGYMSLFWDAPQGAAACCRGNILTLLSSLVLFASGMADGFVTFIFLFVYLLLVRTAGPFFGGANVIQAALTGGTLFCAVFVVSMPGTMPMTRSGKSVYAVLCGVFAFFIAGDTPALRSMPFAILCANVVAILLRYAEDLFIEFVAARKSAHGDAVQGGRKVAAATMVRYAADSGNGMSGLVSLSNHSPTGEAEGHKPKNVGGKDDRQGS